MAALVATIRSFGARMALHCPAMLREPGPETGGATDRAHSRRWLVLGVLCLAVFTTMVDTSIVNVALPTLVRDLHASTRDLLWVVDSYNLVFGALVLAAGSLSDRFGRKGALIAGLTIFGLASAGGSAANDPTQLIVARVVMGVGAAFVFPATLSIITNVFTDRTERATAIGAWGATAGAAVAFGPITGGALLGQFWWGSIFVVMVPMALLAVILVALIVPTSRDPAVPRLDKPGFVLSIAGLGVLVFTIIEAPGNGWMTARTLVGFALAAAILIAFVAVERRTAAPMLDVSLFKNLQFSAASGAVAVAFFAMFGFLFLVTQYFQFAKGYSPLSTGLRMLPIAMSVGVTALIGTQLAVRFGHRMVVGSGLGIMSVTFVWLSTDTALTSYRVIAIQMVVAGIGIGLTSAPATEAIMDVVPPSQAGIGSAVNDATREIGGTLGVAIIGSVAAWLYAASFDRLPIGAALPKGAVDLARSSLGAAESVAARLQAGGDPQAGRAILRAANDGFHNGFSTGSMLAAGVTLVGCVAAAILLPGPRPPHADTVATDFDLVELERVELERADLERASAVLADPVLAARAFNDLLPTRR